MSARTIDIADPGPDGPILARHLRERGFRVTERSIAELRERGSDAALVILAGDAEGCGGVLRALRRVPATAALPVVLIGGPDDEELSAGGVVALGADAYYPRPVPWSRLLRKVETYLSPPETRLAQPPQDREDAAAALGCEPTQAASDPSLGDWSPPERTLQLRGEEESASHSLGSQATAAEEVSASPSAPSAGRAASGPPSSPPPSPPRSSSRPSATSPAQGPPAQVSTRLQKLMLDADRRVFPTLTPLDVRFPAADEAARDLVPFELLELVSLPLEPAEEDPLEAFTYIGPAPEAGVEGPADGSGARWLSVPGDSSHDTSESPVGGPPAMQRRPSRPPPEPPGGDGRAAPVASVGAASLPLTRDEIGFGDRTHEGRSREGALGEGDALRLLWRAAGMRHDVRVSLTLQGEDELRLRISDGELRACEGAIASRVLARLQREGRGHGTAAGEREAAAILEQRVEAGSLGRFELDRMLRRAREEALHDAIASGDGRFSMRPVLDGAPLTGSVLATSLKACLFEGARRRLTLSRVCRLFGSSALKVHMLPGARAALEGASVEPEIMALIERHEGASIDRLLAATRSDEGLPGALYALVAAGAVELVAAGGGETGDPNASETVRATVDAAVRLADSGDYFSILGVRPEATSREVRTAHDARVRELGGLNLVRHRLEALDPARQRALEAVDEAFEMMRDDRLRDRYRRALGLGGPETGAIAGEKRR